MTPLPLDPSLPRHVQLLAALLRQPGWGPRRLAQALGVSERTLRAWRSGESEPRPQLMALLRHLLAEATGDSVLAAQQAHEAIEASLAARGLTIEEAQALLTILDRSTALVLAAARQGRRRAA